MYFRGTDDTVWRVKTDGSNPTNPGGFTTKSDVFVAADGFMYFRGTDDTVWKASRDGNVHSNPGGFKTQSDVFVAAHGYHPILWTGLAGHWQNVGGDNANIVPTVANGQVYVASNMELDIFGLATPGKLAQGTQSESLLPAPAAMPLPEVSGSRFFGTIMSVDIDRVAIRLRRGETLAIDLTNAR